jgi:guanylate kinase
MFVILSGSSGVGKNTIIQKLEQLNDKYKLMPTFTTRDRRENEVEGYPFFFITKEQFEEKIKNNEFIEYEPMHNKFVGSTYQVFNDYIEKGKILIKDLGVDGAQTFAEKVKNKTEVVKVFVTAKSKDELKMRLKFRKEKQIHLRLKRYAYEQKQRFKFDWIVLNDTLQDTCNIINQIIEFKNKDFLPTVKVKRINIKKVTKYFHQLKEGKNLKPVTVAIMDSKPYIVKGIERFIASLLSKKPIVKQIIVKKRIKKLSIQDYKDYKELLKKEI